MPQIEDEQDTLEQSELEGEQEEVDTQDGAEGDSSDSGDGDDEHGRESFLVVDERTKYRTREDAIRGYQEAGKRIAQLSAWEKELKEYGELTPADVRGYLDELIQARQALAQAQDQIKKFQTEGQRQQAGGDKGATRSEDDSTLNKDEKEALAWLQKRFPQLGVVSKSELQKLSEELTGKLGQIEQFQQAEQARYRENLISDGRTKLKTWMSDAQLTDDDEGSLQLMIEGYIRDYINADEGRVARFYKGGATTEALLKEGFERASKALGLIRQTTQSSYAKNKAEALKRNPKKLPQPGLAKKSNAAPGKDEKRINAAGKRDYLAEAHNKAWAVANGRWSAANREE